MTRRAAILLLILGFPALAGCDPSRRQAVAPTPPVTAATRPVVPTLTPFQAKVMGAARAQVGDAYDPSYRTLSYPNGDPPKGEGACTDVVVRSLRAGGYDLQALVHRDMSAHWDQYPHISGLRRPDPNIDHRRVPNLARFFTRHGRVLTNVVSPRTLPQWQPGDIVCWKIPSDHTDIVSDRRDPAGVPYVIHNMSQCAEQDVLTLWPIVGHYRYPAAVAPRATGRQAVRHAEKHSHTSGLGKP